MSRRVSMAIHLALDHFHPLSSEGGDDSWNVHIALFPCLLQCQIYGQKTASAPHTNTAHVQQAEESNSVLQDICTG